ncbi:neuropeptides capa receptor-like [Gigantopelta aegis]|uniref:neuropeptides capa receptor-like n=1 Tax=Gigantopelta aegis TaxID=1735272 RepID=UPI001B889340|nr:neuropeptides capa receptor-like [Gigantopelta aegis]
MAWNMTWKNTTHLWLAEDILIQKIGTVLYTYILPVIVGSGFIGNSLSIWVFFRKSLRKLSSSVYVLAVLVSDTGFLVSLLFVWLEVLGYYLNHAQGVCQVLVYLTYVCSFLSVWYMVCVTVENFITICHPTHVQIMCTRARATTVVIVLALAALIMYSLSVMITKVRQSPGSPRALCEKNLEYQTLTSIFTYVDSIITLLIPLSGIAIMLTAMVLSTANSFRWRTESSPNRELMGRRLSAANPQVRVAKMLFALSVSFLVMNSPIHVVRLYYLLRSNSPTIADLSYGEGLMHLVLLFVSYSNCSIKVFLFLIFSRNFRKTLRNLCKGLIGCVFKCNKYKLNERTFV